jgi:hypothetical protein
MGRMERRRLLAQLAVVVCFAFMLSSSALGKAGESSGSVPASIGVAFDQSFDASDESTGADLADLHGDSVWRLEGRVTPTFDIADQPIVSCAFDSQKAPLETAPKTSPPAICS